MNELQPKLSGRCPIQTSFCKCWCLPFQPLPSIIGILNFQGAAGHASRLPDLPQLLAGCMHGPVAKGSP